MLAPELVAPKGANQKDQTNRQVLFLGVSVALAALALIALVTINSGSERKELLWDDMSSPTGQAAAIRGSVSTADAEATAIMQTNGLRYDEDMGVPYTRDGIETSGHFDQTQVADAIIDNANTDNEDVTGKLRADLYTQTVQDLKDPQLLRGSLPTYRAESEYILGGVKGNYEKSLENSAAAGLSTNGKANPRNVANLIIDSAYRGVRDCTGSTDDTGAHGPGKGMPPCPFSTVFKQGRCPENMQIRQGEFTSADGEECSCIPGYFGPDTSGPCSECPENFYCPGGAVLKIDHASPKLPCPAHSTSSAGQDTCICGAGYVGTPAGNPATCAACPSGQYCPGDGQAFNCPSGKEPNAEQTECVDVPPTPPTP